MQGLEKAVVHCAKGFDVVIALRGIFILHGWEYIRVFAWLGISIEIEIDINQIVGITYLWCKRFWCGIPAGVLLASHGISLEPGGIMVAGNAGTFDRDHQGSAASWTTPNFASMDQGYSYRAAAMIAYKVYHYWPTPIDAIRRTQDSIESESMD